MFSKITFGLIALILATISTIDISQAADPATPATIETTSKVVQNGVFKGRNKHETSGGVSIIKTSNGYIAVLEGDFSLDGAPAPTLGFGKNGFDKKTEFTKLNANKGLQVYAIPATIKPENYDEFYVWCADFSVALGVASLK